jgi:hypothetical protein
MPAQNAETVRQQEALVRVWKGTADRLAIEVDTLRVALEEIKLIHWDRDGYCNECGGNWPCATRCAAHIRAILNDGMGASHDDVAPNWLVEQAAKAEARLRAMDPATLGPAGKRLMGAKYWRRDDGA